MVFLSSDLNQRGRAVLNAARGGEARVRDKDGLTLLILPAERVLALRAFASAAANLCVLEHALASKRRDELAIQDYGDWTWLRVFDADDLAQFIAEMRETLIVAGREESMTNVEPLLHQWRVTASQLEDPLLRSVLLGKHSDADFIEVSRPE